MINLGASPLVGNVVILNLNRLSACDLLSAGQADADVDLTHPPMPGMRWSRQKSLESLFVLLATGGNDTTDISDASFSNLVEHVKQDRLIGHREELLCHSVGERLKSRAPAAG